jgi:hypothetical protein
MNAPRYSYDTQDVPRTLIWNAAASAAYLEPTMQELRAAPGVELRLYAAPDAAAYTTLAAKATYDAQLLLPPAAWIVGLSAASVQPEGFTAQITMPTGTALLTVPANSRSLKGARPFYLPRPAGLPDGGPVRLRLINQSPAANLCQLVIWVVQPS